MKKDGLSFRHAVELLRAPSAAAFTAGPKTARTLPPPVALEADDRTLLAQVIDYYAERLKQTPAALDYLKKRGLGSPEAIALHRIGFADRTLGLRLPLKNRKDGAEIRTRLERLGIYRESGHEHFNGCLVFPLLDHPTGEILGLYGRKIVEHQTPGLPKHLYLPGPRRGWWNPAALQSKEVILCEAVLDALSFWENDHRHVTSAYGVEGFSEEMLNAFVTAKVERVFIAFDRDEAGEVGAGKVAARLMARGIECRRVLFPHGQDANDYARKTQPAAKALGVLLNASAWMGRGKVSVAAAVSSPVAPAPSSLAALVAKEVALPTPASETKAQSTPTKTEEAAKGKTTVAPSLVKNGEHWFFTLDEREYRVGGLEKSLGGDALKIALRLKVGERFHLDALDLARDSDRRRFVERAAEETGLHVDLLKRDVARLLLAVEQTQAGLTKPAETVTRDVVMTEAERSAALSLLRAPDLLTRILTDFAACGVVGEETNKLVGYLAAVSRKLANPLAVIVQSTSAAGKSALMEAVLAFVPPEERVKYSALTGQALYYLGGDSNLKHKILAIVEEEGAEKASYALKLLQSEGELSIASTGKDPHTGRMVTQEYRVEGPVMIFLTTTAVDIDEELLNRCLILTVDEGREQTAAIHRLQRERETLAGLLRTEARAAVLALHRNAQRLLRALKVVNPYAERLTFQDDRTRSRRDHTKYLALIRVITLLHQYQRPLKTADDDHGNAVGYIEVTLDDIAAANRLAHEVLGRCLDEMPPQTRRLLAHLSRFVAERATLAGCERANVLFTRREIRAFTGWGDTQLRVHLDRLVSLEYLLPHRGDRGQSFVYELLYDGGGGQDGGKHLPGLLDVEKLRLLEASATRAHDYDANLAGPNDAFAGPSRGQNGGTSAGSRADETPDSSFETPPPKPADDENPRPRDDDAAAA